jgi:hypothetical protein
LLHYEFVDRPPPILSYASPLTARPAAREGEFYATFAPPPLWPRFGRHAVVVALCAWFMLMFAAATIDKLRRYRSDAAILTGAIAGLLAAGGLLAWRCRAILRLVRLGRLPITIEVCDECVTLTQPAAWGLAPRRFPTNRVLTCELLPQGWSILGVRLYAIQFDLNEWRFTRIHVVAHDPEMLPRIVQNLRAAIGFPRA